MTTTINKKVKLTLAGLDGNAFSLLGAFRRQARKEGWSKEEVAAVEEKCMAGDYDNLLSTLMAHCEGGGLGLEDDDDE